MRVCARVRARARAKVNLGLGLWGLIAIKPREVVTEGRCIRDRIRGGKWTWLRYDVPRGDVTWFLEKAGLVATLEGEGGLPFLWFSKKGNETRDAYLACKSGTFIHC